MNTSNRTVCSNFKNANSNRIFLTFMQKICQYFDFCSWHLGDILTTQILICRSLQSDGLKRLAWVTRQTRLCPRCSQQWLWIYQILIHHTESKLSLYTKFHYTLNPITNNTNVCLIDHYNYCQSSTFLCCIRPLIVLTEIYYVSIGRSRKFQLINLTGYLWH